MKKLLALPMVSFALLLSACGEEVSTDYFLEHPLALQKQLQTCMTQKYKAADIEACKVAVNAQETLREFLQSEQGDPEKFGERILRAQYEVSVLKQKIVALQGDITKEQNGDKKNELNKKLDILKNEQAVKEKEIRIFLAVAGLNSPE